MVNTCGETTMTRTEDASPWKIPCRSNNGIYGFDRCRGASFRFLEITNVVTYVRCEIDIPLGPLNTSKDNTKR